MTEKSLLRAVLGAIEDPICLLDREGMVQSANAAALSLLDFKEEELVGRSAFEALADNKLKSAMECALACAGVRLAIRPLCAARWKSSIWAIGLTRVEEPGFSGYPPHRCCASQPGNWSSVIPGGT